MAAMVEPNEEGNVIANGEDQPGDVPFELENEIELQNDIAAVAQFRRLK